MSYLHFSVSSQYSPIMAGRETVKTYPGNKQR